MHQKRHAMDGSSRVESEHPQYYLPAMPSDTLIRLYSRLVESLKRS